MGFTERKYAGRFRVFLNLLTWIVVSSLLKESNSMAADNHLSTNPGSVIESGRVRACGGLLISINRSWQATVKPGERPLASFKGMAPLAAWSPTKTIAQDQDAFYLAAVASHDAFWLGFEANEGLHFALTIDVDGRNALTGHRGSTRTLERQPRNFLLIPDQPWFDAMIGPEGGLQQLIPRFNDAVRPIGFATGGEIRLTVYPISEEGLDPPLLQQPQSPVPLYSQKPDASQREPTIHPWVGRNLRRNVKAPDACARLTFEIVEPKIFETLTAVPLPKGMFDDTDSTPPPPVQLF